MGKMTNQDGHWGANSAANWIGYNSFGNTTNLNDGADAKSELWYRMVVDDFLLNDHINPTNFVHTDAGCIGGNSLADYFSQALSSFPYSSDTIRPALFNSPTIQIGDWNQIGTTKWTPARILDSMPVVKVRLQKQTMAATLLESSVSMNQMTRSKPMLDWVPWKMAPHILTMHSHKTLVALPAADIRTPPVP